MTIAVDIDDTITETSKKVSEYLSSYNPTCQTYHALDKIDEEKALARLLISQLCKDFFCLINNNNLKSVFYIRS
jgi:hypothetical protein